MNLESLLDELNITRPPWMRCAACLGTTTGAFFPARGERSNTADICNECPVIDECLEHALATGEKFGVWGGKSERQRRTLRRDRNRTHPATKAS